MSTKTNEIRAQSPSLMDEQAATYSPLAKSFAVLLSRLFPRLISAAIVPKVFPSVQPLLPVGMPAAPQPTALQPEAPAAPSRHVVARPPPAAGPPPGLLRQAAASAEPAVPERLRPKLKLAPRTKPIDASNEPSSASIYGNAKPVDSDGKPTTLKEPDEWTVVAKGKGAPLMAAPARPAIVGDALKRAQEKRGSINWSPPKEATDNTPQIDTSPPRPSRRSKELVSQKPAPLDLVKSVGDLANLTIDVRAASISLSPTGGRPKTKSESERESPAAVKSPLTPPGGRPKTKSESERETPEAAKHPKVPTVTPEPAAKATAAAAPAAVPLPTPKPPSDSSASENIALEVDLSRVQRQSKGGKKSGGQRRKEAAAKKRAEDNVAKPTVAKNQPAAEGSKVLNASVNPAVEKKKQHRASTGVAEPTVAKNRSAAEGSKGPKATANRAADKTQLSQPKKITENKLQTPLDSDRARSNWDDKKWDKRWWMQGSIRGEQVRPLSFFLRHKSRLCRPII